MQVVTTQDSDADVRPKDGTSGENTGVLFPVRDPLALLTPSRESKAPRHGEGLRGGRNPCVHKEPQGTVEVRRRSGHAATEEKTEFRGDGKRALWAVL